MNGYLKFAKEVVRKAGNELIKEKDRNVLRHKKGGDLVTKGDLLVERYIVDSIKKKYPDHVVISEEQDKQDRDSIDNDAEYIWLLDPIDGTKYYSAGVPLYTISLALKHNGKPALGVVYGPELKQMYCASEGNGATLNGRKIHCSGKKLLIESNICLEIPSRHSKDEEVDWALKKMRALIQNAFRVRIIGVGALGLCFCAMAGFDAYVNLGSGWKPWDIAAGHIIAEESGAKYSDTGGKIVAGPQNLHDELIELLELG